ncbi:MAG: rRNA maturation RNase YbeY [Candidatus Omnitrophica bacterium]|nr:rRNA maturation RNase YbeY [Candidatus Omnitrophota bacterium]
MPVELRNSQRRVRLNTARLKRRAEVLLVLLGLENSELSLLLTDDRRISILHRRWMKEEGPTDVLSFPNSPPVLGDVVISLETLQRRFPKDLLSEVTRTLVHGVLHLTGHDHARPKERLRMDRKSRRLLAALERIP